jgi:DMSO/TMAO reductase YedYZ molybdopterin-dependent catalytic subunit
MDLARPARRRVGSASAASGAAASIVVLALVHVVWPSVPFAPIAVAERVLRLTPGGVATLAIDTLGALAEPLLVLGTVAAFLGLVAWAGRSLDPSDAARALWRTVAIGTAFASLAFLVTDPAGRGPALAAALLAAVAVGASVTVWRLQHVRSATTERGVPNAARRETLRALAIAGGGLALAWTGLGRAVFGRPGPETLPLRVSVREAFPPAGPPDPAFESIAGLSPRRTAAADFYTVDTALLDPVVEAETWSLEIGGLAGRPFTIGYEELVSQPATSFDSTLECISNDVGGDLISTGRWTGIPLGALLHRAGVRGDVVEVVSTSVDGYADSIPIDVAMRDTTIVAVGLDGRPLPTAHGFPARLLVPGRYGMKQPKWLASVELVDRPFEGYWERRGWSKAAVVKTMSRIDAVVDGGATSTVAGVAFAGDRGISRVEVSLDAGRTWSAAEIEDPLSPLTWRRWRHRFTPAAEGGTVMVRGTDGRGAVQTQVVAAPHPDGASGYDQVRL